MTRPLRFSALTLNLWNTERWDFREPAVAKFLRLFDPDICCFQELRARTVAALDRLLPTHRRVDDRFRGWTEEGNIYYRSACFAEVEHGCVDLRMPEPDRRLFWVRLRIVDSEDTILVCTAHLTHQGNADEMASGFSYRHGETVLIAAAIGEIADPEEPVLICGDFNDPIHPARILSEAGFIEAFNALGLLPPVTFPSQPCSEELYMNESIDKIMARGRLRPLIASVPNFILGGASCSDHWPTIAMYELSERRSRN